MKFQALKGMIDSLIKTYKCPECSHDVTDSNVDIIGAAGTTINIDIGCPNCSKHSMVRTEVMAFDLGSGNISKEKLHAIKLAIKGVQSTIPTDEILDIKDSEIVELNKELKKNDLSVNDLLKND